MPRKIFNPYQYFGFLTNRTGRLVQLIITPKLKEEGFDIPASCLGILAELWLKDGLSQKEIGHSIIKTKSSINKMLLPMLEAGLVVKKIDDKDKRTNRIFLTPKGKSLKDRMSNVGKEMEEEFLAEHSAEEIAMAKKVLKTLYKNILGTRK